MTQNFYPDFSADGYRYILTQAQERGYRLVRIDEAFASEERSLILRHDIDFSADCAVAMAELEAAIGARATYFFMTSCEYYNIFSEPGRAALQKIRALGHEIGLHWDSRTLPEDTAQHPGFLRAQLTMLAAAAGAPIRSASQHIPTDTPPFDIAPYIEFNAYSATFNERFTYVSDSSMQWREVTPLHHIAEGKDIQFLAHPVWWMAEGRTQDDKIRAAMRDTGAQMQHCAEEYLLYMKKVLADRARYDAYFVQTQSRHA